MLPSPFRAAPSSDQLARTPKVFRCTAQSAERCAGRTCVGRSICRAVDLPDVGHCADEFPQSNGGRIRYISMYRICPNLCKRSGHLVFSTHERLPLLEDPSIRGAMWSYLAAPSEQLRCPTVAVGGTADHVHILGRLATNEYGRRVGARDKALFVHMGMQLRSRSRTLRLAEGLCCVLCESLLMLPGDSVHYCPGGSSPRCGYVDEIRSLLQQQHIDFDERYLFD